MSTATDGNVSFVFQWQVTMDLY